jgi:PASTA domain
VLFVLATLALGGIVATVVVNAVEVPSVPPTTLPQITTLPPETNPPTSEAPTTTQAPTTTGATTTTTGESSTSKSTESTRSAIVTVPNVVGSRSGRATEALQNAGLKVARQDFPVNDRRRVNRVISQLPRGGQQVPRDTTVVIIVGVSN